MKAVCALVAAAFVIGLGDVEALGVGQEVLEPVTLAGRAKDLGGDLAPSGT